MPQPDETKTALDPGMQPAAQWERTYLADIGQAASQTADIVLGLMRDGTPVARHALCILPQTAADRNFRYVERHIKSMLWIYGGNRILFSGPDYLYQRLLHHYKENPTGQFDASVVAENIYGSVLQIEVRQAADIPEAKADGLSVGGHQEGCRIGFDLGGSDRKCAAVIDGKVVFSEEIPWDPYFQKDPQYHYDGMMDSIQRAAAHLPRIDAIGGSAAGVYVDNEVRVASLFRGVPSEDFEQSVRRIFYRVQAAWNQVPFAVINDGEVTALAGAMALNTSSLLGISMGTSTAAGYVTPQGGLTTWLNELAFTPIDYRPDGPVDEWSGDVGCAVQCFSQQGVARLARLAGLSFPADMPLPEQLLAVQQSLSEGHDAARQIYIAIGQAFGHTLAHWSRFYTLAHVLVLGRVTSGSGGDLILEQARACLQANYPDVASSLQLHTPDETMKRHGQAVAAASLPPIA